MGFSGRGDACGNKIRAAPLDDDLRQRTRRGSRQHGAIGHRKRSAVARAIQAILVDLVEYRARCVGTQAAVGDVVLGRRAQQNAWFDIGGISENLRPTHRDLAGLRYDSRRKITRESRAEKHQRTAGERRDTRESQDFRELPPGRLWIVFSPNERFLSISQLGLLHVSRTFKHGKPGILRKSWIRSRALAKEEGGPFRRLHAPRKAASEAQPWCEASAFGIALRIHTVGYRIPKMGRVRLQRNPAASETRPQARCPSCKRVCSIWMMVSRAMTPMMWPSEITGI